MELLIPDKGLIIISILTLLFIIIWISALINILKNEFVGPNDKLIWVLLVSLVPFIGVILYFFIGRKQKIN